MRVLASLVVVAVLLFAAPARAITTPASGAVAFPMSVSLLLPFPAGNEVRILSGYGPAMGSSLHDGFDNTSSANDYYALDLVYDDEANSGKGLPIVSALAGQVVKAGWATAGWANYGLRVIVRHDLGDGHVYHSIYCHLNAIDASIVEGAMVTQGQVLGELGQSCQGALSCGSFSTPHLHWALHRDSTIGGSGTGGSYGGNAVVPEPFDGAEDLLQGMIIGSTNAGTPVCGDGFCTGREHHGSCAEDCPPCTLLPAAGGIVDESEPPCFSYGGTPGYWHDETAGWASSLKWTTATDEASADNFGIWRIAFEQAGDYQLEIHTAAAFAESQQAAYQVTHAGTTDVELVDQTAADGWQPLGTFAFAEGGEQSIRLDDNTGESLSDDRQLVFDALRITGMGGAGGSGASGAGVGGTTEGAGGSAIAAAAGTGGGTPGGETEPGDAGCGCRLAGASGGVRSLAASIVLLGLASRRRRRAPNG